MTMDEVVFLVVPEGGTDERMKARTSPGAETTMLLEVLALMDMMGLTLLLAMQLEVGLETMLCENEVVEALIHNA